jgi:hypothetical protein
MKKFRFLPLMALTALLAIGAMAPLAQAKGTVLRANLHGSTAFPAVTGKAVFKQDGNQRELQVEIENANRLAGRQLNVFVAGKKFGTMRVNNLGVARISKNTELGQAVPFVKAGQFVAVRTLTGTLVASGVFRAV